MIPRGSVAAILIVLSVAAISTYPLAMVLIASFNESSLGEAANYSLEPWRRVLSDPATWAAAEWTLLIGLPRTALAVTVAGLFAWLVARTDMPGRRALSGSLLALFFLPDLPWILAWMMLGAPRVGLLNVWLPILSIDVYSYAGLVILGAARLVPMVFIFILPAFSAMDASLEEAARVSGASRLRTFLSVNLPLITPALLSMGILAFIRSVESFELEQLIGLPAGIYVLSTRIYDLGFTGTRAVLGEATATALLLLTAGLMLMYVQILVSRRASVATVTGKGYRPARVSLGRWRWPAVGASLLYVLVLGLLPFLVLFAGSFMAVSGFFSWDLLTLDHWRDVLLSSSVLGSIRNTIVVAAVAASLCTASALLIAYIVHRTSWPLRTLIEAQVWMPLAVPGIVLSLAFLWAFVDLPIYGTLWLLVLVLGARGLPIATQQTGAGLTQLGRELDEAARVHGASWWQTARRVLLPLMASSALAGWIIVFTFSVRTVDVPLLLTAQGTRLLSVDIFQWTSGGRLEGAVVLAMIQTGIIAAAYLLARTALGTTLIGHESVR